MGGWATIRQNKLLLLDWRLRRLRMLLRSKATTRCAFVQYRFCSVHAASACAPAEATEASEARTSAMAKQQEIRRIRKGLVVGCSIGGGGMRRSFLCKNLRGRRMNTKEAREALKQNCQRGVPGVFAGMQPRLSHDGADSQGCQRVAQGPRT